MLFSRNSQYNLFDTISINLITLRTLSSLLDYSWNYSTYTSFLYVFALFSRHSQKSTKFIRKNSIFYKESWIYWRHLSFELASNSFYCLNDITKLHASLNNNIHIINNPYKRMYNPMQYDIKPIISLFKSKSQ